MTFVLRAVGEDRTLVTTNQGRRDLIRGPLTAVRDAAVRHLADESSPSWQLKLIDPAEILVHYLARLDERCNGSIPQRVAANHSVSVTTSVVPEWEPHLLHAASASPERSGGTYVPVLINVESAIIGPITDSALPSAGVNDLIERMVAAAGNRRQWTLERSRPIGQVSFDASDLQWVAARLIEIIDRLTRSDPRTLLDRAWFLDFHSRTCTERIVLRSPARGPSQATHSAEDVLDPVTGIVIATNTLSSLVPLPRGMVLGQSRAADMGRVMSWANNLVNGGCAWDSERDAHWIAVAESIERYSGNAVSGLQTRHGSYDQIIADGNAALDPNLLEFFNADQHSQPGFPFLPFIRTTETTWVTGRKMSDGSPSWVPASLVYVNWNLGGSYADPPLHPAFYPGIAAGSSRSSAEANALEELIERDSMMAMWLSGARLPRVELPAAERWRFAALPASLEVDAVMIPNEFAVPVAMTCLRDHASRSTAMGFAARNTSHRAIMKALLEAFGLLHAVADMRNPDGHYWRLMRAYPEMQTTCDHRADDDYIAAMGTNFRRVTDLWPQLQTYLDPRTFDWPLSWDPDLAPGHVQETHDLARDADQYLARLVAAGIEPYCVDLTTPDVAACGFHVVRVVAPGLIPNFPTAFPPLGGGRYRRVAQLQGWDVRSDGPNPLPMPYA